MDLTDTYSYNIASAYSSKKLFDSHLPSSKQLVAVSMRQFIVNVQYFNNNKCGNKKMQEGSISVSVSFDTCKVKLHF